MVWYGWPLEVFLNFFNNKKMIFCLFYHFNLICLGVGFLNRTFAEIGD